MPTANETLENRALDGDELKQVILKEVENMLNRDAMFSKRLSYPRAAYRLKLQLFLPTPNYPEHTAKTESADPARNERDPKKKLLTKPPAHQPATWGMQRDRVIESPNLARLANNIPIIQQRRNLETGRIEEVPIKYEADPNSLSQYADLNVAQDKEIAGENWT